MQGSHNRFQISNRRADSFQRIGCAPAHFDTRIEEFVYDRWQCFTRSRPELAERSCSAFAHARVTIAQRAH